MSTFRRILLSTSLALASAGLAAAMALDVLPAGPVDLRQGLDVVGPVEPVPRPIGCPVPLDINCGTPRT